MERVRGGQGDGGPGGLSLEECCLYLERHISHTAKNKWAPPRCHHKLHPWSSWRSEYFPPPWVTLNSSLFWASFYPLSLRIPLPHRSSRFQLSWQPNTHCHSNLIPPFCCPPLPARHAHLCLLYVLWQQSFLPGHTRIAVTVENGCFFLFCFFFFFLESVSVWGDLQWQSAWLGEGGGCCQHPVTMGQTHRVGAEQRGRLLKRPWFF